MICFGEQEITRPGLLANAFRDLEAFSVAVAGHEVLFVPDKHRNRVFIGGHKAGLWIYPHMPANKFELIKGGFRIDIAEHIMAMIGLLGMSKVDALEASVVPQISGPEKQEK